MYLLPAEFISRHSVESLKRVIILRQSRSTCKPGAFLFFYPFKHSRRSPIKIVNIKKKCKPHLLDVTASEIILCPEVYKQQLYKLRVTLQLIILSTSTL